MPTIRYRIHMENDDWPEIAGSFASGDDKADRKQVKKIQNRLDAGDEWAWFGCSVIAKCDGYEECSDWLGGCSYASEEDFKASDYYKEMCDQARDRLLSNLKEAAELYRELTQG